MSHPLALKDNVTSTGTNGQCHNRWHWQTMSHTDRQCHTHTLMANKSHPLAYLHWSQACIKQSLTPTDYGQQFHLLTLHGTVSAVFFLPTSCILHNHWMASQPPTTPRNKTHTHTHTHTHKTKTNCKHFKRSPFSPPAPLPVPIYLVFSHFLTTTFSVHACPEKSYPNESLSSLLLNWWRASNLTSSESRSVRQILKMEAVFRPVSSLQSLCSPQLFTYFSLHLHNAVSTPRSTDFCGPYNSHTHTPVHIHANLCLHTHTHTDTSLHPPNTHNLSNACHKSKSTSRLSLRTMRWATETSHNQQRRKKQGQKKKSVKKLRPSNAEGEFFCPERRGWFHKRGRSAPTVADRTPLLCHEHSRQDWNPCQSAGVTRSACPRRWTKDSGRWWWRPQNSHLQSCLSYHCCVCNSSRVRVRLSQCPI